MKYRKYSAAAFILMVFLFLTGCFSDKYEIELFIDRVAGEDPFNKPAVDGLNSAIKIYDVSGSIREAVDDNSFPDMFSSISRNSDLIICLGYKTQEYAAEASVEYPDKNFVVIDTSYDSDYDNLIGISYRVNENSFLVGYIAGMTTQTGKIGFVGGMETENIYTFEYGFRAGVLYASNSKGSIIEVEEIYINDFANPQLGKNAASDLYSNGCDIVFHAAGGSGTGVIEAAKELNKYVIGVDVDQSYLAPDNVLTSALKDVKTTVILTVNDYKNNDVYRGGTKYLGLYEGAVGIPELNPLVDKNVLLRTQELKELIINGVIIPPSTQQEYDLFAQN